MLITITYFNVLTHIVFYQFINKSICTNSLPTINFNRRQARKKYHLDLVIIELKRFDVITSAKNIAYKYLALNALMVKQNLESRFVLSAEKFKLYF